MTTVSRRRFLGGLGAASAWTIVPRRVLGGAGYVAPSDMILLAQVGCGTQAQRQVNMELVDAAGPAVRRRRRSEPGQPGLRGLGAVGQPRGHPASSSAIPRGARATPGSAPAATWRAA